MEFIPLFTEDYSLLIRKEATEQKNIADLIDVLKSDTFSSLVSGISGYDAAGAGAVKRSAKPRSSL